MDKGSNGRDGKLVSGGHSTRVEGLNALLKELERWPEIASIRLGRITRKNRVGRKSKKLKPDNNSAENTGIRVVRGHKRAKSGGGFSFRATRLAMVGSLVTGITCYASYGTNVQLVVLSGANLDALKARLQAEGFGAEW